MKIKHRHISIANTGRQSLSPNAKQRANSPRDGIAPTAGQGTGTASSARPEQTSTPIAIAPPGSTPAVGRVRGNGEVLYSVASAAVLGAHVGAYLGGTWGAAVGAAGGPILLGFARAGLNTWWPGGRAASVLSDGVDLAAPVALATTFGGPLGGAIVGGVAAVTAVATKFGALATQAAPREPASLAPPSAARQAAWEADLLTSPDAAARQAAALALGHIDTAEATLLRVAAKTSPASQDLKRACGAGLAAIWLRQEHLQPDRFALLGRDARAEALACLEKQRPAWVDYIDAWESLHAMEGLEEIKQMVGQLCDTFQADARRRQWDKTWSPPQQPLPSAVFSGAPGTGKTTAARLYARILKGMGLLKKGDLVEVRTSDLIAEYMGSTGPKTTKKLEEAVGGVLFLDEAYGLLDGGDYGKQAVEEIVQFLGNRAHEVVVVLAGYEHDMARLLRSNAGLGRRLEWQVKFPNYSDDVLERILLAKATAEKYTVTPSVAKRAVRERLPPRDARFGNAGAVHNLLRAAVRRKNAALKTATNNPDPFELRWCDFVPPDGHGVFTEPDGSHYEGHWNAGKPQGRGVMTYPDGTRYEGEFEAGKPHGRGLMTYPNGQTHDGVFHAGTATFEWIERLETRV